MTNAKNEVKIILSEGPYMELRVGIGIYWGSRLLLSHKQLNRRTP